MASATLSSVDAATNIDRLTLQQFTLPGRFLARSLEQEIETRFRMRSLPRSPPAHYRSILPVFAAGSGCLMPQRLLISATNAASAPLTTLPAITPRLAADSPRRESGSSDESQQSTTSDIISCSRLQYVCRPSARGRFQSIIKLTCRATRTQCYRC